MSSDVSLRCMIRNVVRSMIFKTESLAFDKIVCFKNSLNHF